MMYALDGVAPVFHETSWVAPGTHLIGKIQLEEKTSIWFGTTMRGDNEEIRIGAGSNVQENCVLHTDMGYPLQIGSGCTIGHKAMLHGCIIGENSLIGMGATVLNRTVIGKNCLVGANALVTEDKEFPDGSLIVGSPAKAVRTLDEAGIAHLKYAAQSYQQRMRMFRDTLKPVG